MQTIIIQLDRVQDTRHSPETKQVECCLEDSGGKVSPAFVVTVKGHHTTKHYRVAVTENGTLKTVRLKP